MGRLAELTGKGDCSCQPGGAWNLPAREAGEDWDCQDCEGECESCPSSSGVLQAPSLEDVPACSRAATSARQNAAEEQGVMN